MMILTFILLLVHSEEPCQTLLLGSPPVCYGGADVEFYKSFDGYLPTLDLSWKNKNDLEIYLPNLEMVRSAHPLSGCHPDDSFANPSDKTRAFTGPPSYFTWVSKEYGQPILATVRSPACGNSCPNEKGRGCKKFQTCLISGVSHNDYTNSDLDRGHLVPNGAMGHWFDKGASTFNMCNIGTQSKRLNQDDWQVLERWVQCIGTQKVIVVHAGPLFDNEAMNYCVCHGEPAGSHFCDECQSRAIPMAYGFWKVLVMEDLHGSKNAWSWIYTTSQEECLHNIELPQCRPGPVIQSLNSAYNSTGLEFIAKNLQFEWPKDFKQQTNMDGLNNITACSKTLSVQKFSQNDFIQETARTTSYR